MRSNTSAVFHSFTSASGDVCELQHSDGESAQKLVQEIGLILRILEKKPLPPKGKLAAKRIEAALRDLEESLHGDVAPSSAPEMQPAASAVQPATGAARSATLAKWHKAVDTAKAQADLSLQPGSLAPALNALVAVLWPRIGTFVKNLITDSIQPSINASLPGLLTRGGGVKFTKVDLGDCAPQFGPITVDHDKETGALTLHMGINITTDLDIALTAIGIPIEIMKFFLKGEMLILLSPPMMKPPFFGGMQIYFPNPPDVGISFGGAARVADIPGLNGAIRGAIDGAVAGICVLPRRIAVDMNDEDDVDMVDLSYPDPVHILRFTLWSASDLVASDTHVFGQDSSDPYVLAKLGMKTWQSPHISKNLNPVWGGNDGLSMDFPVHDDCQALILKVYDYDFGNADDLIGYAPNLLTRDLEEGRQSLDLLTEEGTPGGGSVEFSARKLTLVSTRPSPPMADAGLAEAHLSVKLRTIRGLADDAGYPFKVKVQLCGSKDKVLVEEVSQASHPQETKQLAEAYQGIAKHLQEKGTDIANIAEILEVGVAEVESFLAQASFAKEEKKKAEVERANIKQPRFDEVVQLLLPCKSVQDGSVIVLTILDKKQKPIGTARVPMSMVLEAPDLLMPMDVTATDASDVTVVGSLRLRWLADGAGTTQGTAPVPSSRSKSASLSSATAPASSSCDAGGDLDALFDVAQKAAKTRSDLGKQAMLQLYAHYKQATVGPAAGSRPGLFDQIGRAKWDAWDALGSMSQTDAKLKYCDFVDGIVPNWRP